jgi:hypothetical protein
MAWSEFYGKIRGRSSTEATRCGNRDSGLSMVAASKTGAITVKMWYAGGKHFYQVRLTDWGSSNFDDIPLATGSFPTDEKGVPEIHLPDDIVRAHVEREALRAMKED